MEEKFIFSGKYKFVSLLLILTGLIAVVAGFFVYHDHGSRFWANFLMNTTYFNAIALCGVVFIAVHMLGNSGWQVSIQRVPEAMSMFLPVSGFLMLVILAGLWFNFHHLYHWAHPDPHDTILELKKGYLNIPFFSIRTIIYIAGWIIFARILRKISVLQDNNNDLKYFKKSTVYAALFIVFFAITSSTSAWDWLMSIDAHWYSTMYGWYIFSGLFVSGTAVIILLVLFLKGAGYMKHVNKEHLHDLGKYLFGFSIFWTYLWFSQYLLIWYGNIPEETAYYVPRLDEYRNLFFINLGVNFIFPFLALMTRNSKRQPWILAMVSVVAFIGHWIDYYLIVMPGTMGAEAGIGFFEIGMTLGYIGMFLFVVFWGLTKASLVPENHPYYKESMEYHTQY
ncbi:MAG: hypothetical protein JXJ22_11985 [Bacteroidales bacterium]|nr:hypothetical protein [Bacteroidales bacterium]